MKKGMMEFNDLLMLNGSNSFRILSMPDPKSTFLISKRTVEACQYL